MPEFDQTVGDVAIDVRARLDPLDRDLAQAKSRLDNFERSSNGATRAAGALEHATSDAAKAVHTLGENTSNTQRQLTEQDRAVTQLTRAVEEHTRALTVNNRATQEVVQASTASNAANQTGTRSWVQMSREATETGKSFFKTAFNVLQWVGYIKLAASVATVAARSNFPALGVALDRVGVSGGVLSRGIGRATNAVDNFVPGTRRAVDGLRAFHKVAEGAEILTLGNQFRYASAAALALSPALRQVAAKEVTGGLAAIPQALGIAVPAAFSLGRTILTFLAPALVFLAKLALPILAIYGIFKGLVELFQLGGREIERITGTVRQAAEAGVSFDFFQRHNEAAKAFAVTADVATQALKNFRNVSEERLGGSEFEKKLNELTAAGNFVNNAGVAALRSAVTVEERYRAVGQLIAEAGRGGERLAALELARTFAPPEMVERMQVNIELLEEMDRKAKEVAENKLINEEDAVRAAELKRRLEEALKVLREQWNLAIPGLTRVGIEMQALMVRGVEKAAELVGWFGELPGKIAAAIATIQPFLDRIIAFLRTVASFRLPGMSRGFISEGLPESTNVEDRRPEFRTSIGDATEAEMRSARNRLIIGFSAQNNVLRSGRETMEGYTRVLGDNSKRQQENTAATNASVDAWTRAVRAIDKQTGSVLADTAALGKGIGERTKLRAEMQLLEAAAASGVSITREQMDAYIQLRGSMDSMQALERVGIHLGAERARVFQEITARAGETRAAYEKLKVLTDAKFELGTAFLSDEDVKVAEKLRGIYGDHIPSALASSEAAALRFVSRMKEARDIAERISASAIIDFKNELMNGASAWDSFRKAGANALNSLADEFLKFASRTAVRQVFGMFTSMFGGGMGIPTATPLDITTGSFHPGLYHGGGIIGKTAVPKVAVNPIVFHNAPSFARGSLPFNLGGDSVPIIAHKKEVIGYPEQMARAFGGSTVNAPINVTLDARGADERGIERAMAQLKSELPRIVLRTVTDAQSRRML